MNGKQIGLAAERTLDYAHALRPHVRPEKWTSDGDCKVPTQQWDRIAMAKWRLEQVPVLLRQRRRDDAFQTLVVAQTILWFANVGTEAMFQALNKSVMREARATSPDSNLQAAS